MRNLIAAVVIAASTLVAVEPVMVFYDWADHSLSEIRAHEEHRQNDIQQLVCEANGTPQAACPVVTLPGSVVSSSAT